MNTREENSDSIPIDLVPEILSRLPAISIARFRCVSKLWGSILCRPYFTELFLTRSSARPRLLFALERAGVWCFFSLPQSLNPSSLSLVVAADSHIKFPLNNMWIYYRSSRIFSYAYASGLIHFPDMWISKEPMPAICNPNTGQYVILPKLRKYILKSYNYFGFDPIDKQFKVLFIAYPSCDDDHNILALGTGEMMWRKIQCPLPHQPLSEGMCINGVLYYLAQIDKTSCAIVCFDVSSEEFKFISGKSFCGPPMTKLINYKGKLGGISLWYAYADERCTLELRMWVLEDAEKQEWSTYVYTLLKDKAVDHYHVVGDSE